MVNCNECNFISVTEEEQHTHSIYKLDHRCLKHGHYKLFHRNNHKGIDDFIYPCRECNGIDFMKRD